MFRQSNVVGHLEGALSTGDDFTGCGFDEIINLVAGQRTANIIQGYVYRGLQAGIITPIVKPEI